MILPVIISNSFAEPDIESDSADIEFDSALNQQLGLLSQHMASAFPSSAFGSGSPSMISASELGNGNASQLAPPVYQQHA